VLSPGIFSHAVSDRSRSDHEGNPHSVIEAMAAGLPIVSTAVGGVPELLQDGKEGFIVQSGFADPLSEATMTLLKDADLRRTMGAAPTLCARENFNVSLMVRAYEKLYDEISDPSRTWGPLLFRPQIDGDTRGPRRVKIR